MPRYFFTTEDGQVIRDEDGEELHDEASARREAVRFMGAILKDHPGDFLDQERWRMIVSDEARGDLFTVEVSMETGSGISDWGHPRARSSPSRTGE